MYNFNLFGEHQDITLKASLLERLGLKTNTNANKVNLEKSQGFKICEEIKSPARQGYICKEK